MIQSHLEARLGVAVAALSVLLTGCGGGSSPRVSSVASSTTAATTTTRNRAVAFSRCIRSHGVPNFPHPPPIGARTPKLRLRQLGVRESQFQAARRACKHPAPNGSQAAPTAGRSHAATSGCDSLATCYTPRQLEAAYGVLPLLEDGTDGRGETVVLPELAEPQFPLPSSDIRRDLAQFDRLFHLPATRVRVVGTLAPSASRWLANGEE